MNVEVNNRQGSVLCPEPVLGLLERQNDLD